MSLRQFTKRLPAVAELDLSRISGPSSWVIQPAYLSFSNSLMGKRLRMDMSRLKGYAVLYGLLADKSVWRSFISHHDCFSTPETIQWDLTFAWDHKEAYYLPAREDFIKHRSKIGKDFNLFDIPLPQQNDTLLFRFWHLFKVTAHVTTRIKKLTTNNIWTTSVTYDMDEEKPNHELRCIFGPPPSC